MKLFNSATSHFSVLFTMLTIFVLPKLVYANIAWNVDSHIIFDSIEGLIVGILNILLVIAIPIIVFFIIYGGFLYVTAQGNTQQVEQATKTLTYAIIGGVLIIGAVTIATVVKNVVDSFTPAA